MANSTKVDLNAFKAQDIRDILKSKAHCLQAGFPVNHSIIVTFEEILDNYVNRVGLRTYLSQMLGNLANIPAHNCAFFDENNRAIDVYPYSDGKQPVQKFIARQFNSKLLPFRVDIRKQSDSRQVETRYL
jgi:hypothetical protein